MLQPVSIIVPIKDRGSLLPNLIKNLSNLNYPNYEIIIVDDCSTDNTKNLLRKYPIKSIVLKKSVGSAEARNVGISEAKNDIIALTDSDCFVSRNWLKDLVPFLKKYDIVGGRVEFCDRAERKLNPSIKIETVLKKESSVNFLNSSNMLFKKELVTHTGGFLNYRIEDLEFSWRALKKGFRLIYVPKGLVIHHGKRTTFQNIKRYIQYGKSYSKIAAVHNMDISFKPESIYDRKTMWNYLQLIAFPFLLLLALFICGFVILNMIFYLSLNAFSLAFLIYLFFRIMRRIDIIYKLYKFSIIFSIINFNLIYLLKKVDKR
ncbi:MAG: glycosyltransferase family 2 protein [Promethearchaeia archaeon]